MERKLHLDSCMKMTCPYTQCALLHHVRFYTCELTAVKVGLLDSLTVVLTKKIIKGEARAAGTSNNSSGNL
jgi:hypothetical protein